MCITFYPCKEPEIPGVYWRDDREWRAYDMATAKAILQAIANGVSEIKLGTFKSAVYPKGAQYTANLEKMKQYNTGPSNQDRDILVIRDPETIKAVPVQPENANATTNSVPSYKKLPFANVGPFPKVAVYPA